MYKLLIVEDEHLILEGLVKGIPWNDIGFEVSGSAVNGAEALLSSTTGNGTEENKTCV